MNRHARAAALRARATGLRETAADLAGETGPGVLAEVLKLRAARLELAAMILGWPR